MYVDKNVYAVKEFEGELLSLLNQRSPFQVRIDGFQTILYTERRLPVKTNFGRILGKGSCKALSNNPLSSILPSRLCPLKILSCPLTGYDFSGTLSPCFKFVFTLENKPFPPSTPAWTLRRNWQDDVSQDRKGTYSEKNVPRNRNIRLMIATNK